MRDRLPNFLFVMADQMAAPALPVYGHPLVKAPHIETLAHQGVVFENAYCNAPLCAPSRFSMLSGQLPSRIGAYDNAAEFPAATPTLPHYLRLMGYRTCTAGKMHFVGPDQLHGFEERLTTDIYPADFDWTADWEQPETRLPWYHDMLSVTQAGPCARSLQIDFDDETAFRSVRRIYDFARDDDARPFFLAVSFSHPHDPYTITHEYWDRYDHDAIDPPRVAPLPDAARDPHSRRLYRVTGMEAQTPTEAQTRNARHAYYGAISYVDDRLGELLHALSETGLAEDTVVIFTADHGDMLGERGMWYKMTFFEWSARVPLIVHAPARLAARRVTSCVSLVDLLPTVLALAGDAAPEPADALDGKSLVPLLDGGPGRRDDTVLGEYCAEGAVAPVIMIRRGVHKYVACEADPPQLFDLAADPDERDNLTQRPEYAERLAAFAAEVEARWDTAELGRAVIASQGRRRFVAEALGNGRRTSWDFQPRRDAAREYVRTHAVLGDIEQRARLPRTRPLGDPPGSD